jgi:hypothetical protein
MLILSNINNSFNSVKVGAKLRNHNILKGIVNLLMGEYGRRTHEFIVTIPFKIL